MRFAILSVLSMLLLVQTASAEIDYFNGMATLKDNTVEHHIIMRFSEQVSTFEWTLPFDIYDLRTESDFKADCRIERKSIKCTLLTEPNNTLTLKFSSKLEVSEEDEKKVYTLYYTFPLITKFAIVFIKLPLQSILSEDVTNTSFFPQDGKVMTDGKHIIIYWERNDLKAGEGLTFSVKYMMPEKPSFDAYIWHILIPTLAIVIIVPLVAIYIIRRVRRKVIVEVLLPDEKVVIDFLRQKGGETLQKHLVRELDFSKAKVSRLIKALEKRGVVKVVPVSGRENRIILVEKHEKRIEKDSGAEDKKAV